MRTERMRRLSRALLALLATLWVSGRAAAQVDAQIGELNSQALEAYQALDIDTARSKLEQGVGMAQQAGYVGPVVAQTYMNLGVVLVAGQNDRDQGLAAFLSAVCIQPNVQLDPLLSTPDVQLVFGQAQQDAQGGACGPGAGAGRRHRNSSTCRRRPRMMAPAAAGPRADEECPPGVVCNGGEGGSDAGPNDFARFFVNVQLAEGFALVRSGHEGRLEAAAGEIFESHDRRDRSTQRRRLHRRQRRRRHGWHDRHGRSRFLFDTKSAWVPDADSFDDYENVGPEHPAKSRSRAASRRRPRTARPTASASGPPDLTDPKTNSRSPRWSRATTACAS